MKEGAAKAEITEATRPRQACRPSILCLVQQMTKSPNLKAQTGSLFPCQVCV